MSDCQKTTISYDICEVDYRKLVKAAKAFKHWYSMEINRDGIKGVNMDSSTMQDRMDALAEAQHALHMALGIVNEESRPNYVPRLVLNIGDKSQ